MNDIVSLNSTAPASTTIEGAEVNIVAQWNERKNAVGRYQAPESSIIRSAVPRVRSATRASYNVAVSADNREAILTVTVSGSGEWWNQERGWFDGYLQIEIEPSP